MYAPEMDITQLAQFHQTHCWEAGLQLSHTLLGQFPHDGRVWELSGLIYHDLTSFDLARGALETANTLIPLSDEAQIALGNCYIHSGQPQLAREMFEFLLEKESLSPALIPQIRRSLQQLIESDHSQEGNRDKLTNPRQTAEHHYNLAYFMGYMGYPVEDIEQEILKAIRLAPECVEYRIGLAGFLSQINRAEEGYHYVAQLSKKTISKLECECCLERLIKVYQAGGDHQLLIACLNRSQELKQRNVKESITDDQQ